MHHHNHIESQLLIGHFFLHSCRFFAIPNCSSLKVNGSALQHSRGDSLWNIFKSLLTFLRWHLIRVHAVFVIHTIMYSNRQLAEPLKTRFSLSRTLSQTAGERHFDEVMLIRSIISKCSAPRSSPYFQASAPAPVPSVVMWMQLRKHFRSSRFQLEMRHFGRFLHRLQIIVYVSAFDYNFFLFQMFFLHKNISSASKRLILKQVSFVHTSKNLKNQLNNEKMPKIINKCLRSLWWCAWFHRIFHMNAFFLLSFIFHVFSIFLNLAAFVFRILYFVCKIFCFLYQAQLEN